VKTLSIAIALALALAGSTLATETARPNNNASGIKLPEGSRFLTCLNGKALYADGGKSLHQVPDEARCSDSQN
jgi:hypothetical protein